MGRRNKLVTCRYCQIFRTSERIDSKARRCKISGDVFPKTPACDSLKMVEGFWCDKRQTQVEVYICLSRQPKHLGKYCKPTCKQGMAVVACSQFNPTFIPLRRRKG